MEDEGNLLGVDVGKERKGRLYAKKLCSRGLESRERTTRSYVSCEMYYHKWRGKLQGLVGSRGTGSVGQSPQIGGGG